jgi:hypothetical protein
VVRFGWVFRPRGPSRCNFGVWFGNLAAFSDVFEAYRVLYECISLAPCEGLEYLGALLDFTLRAKRCCRA